MFSRCLHSCKVESILSFELGATACQLRRITFGAVGDFLRGSQQPLFVVMAVTAKAAVTFVIAEIQTVGVFGRNAQFSLADRAIPADEVAAIGEIVSGREPAVGLVLIISPSAVLRLRIAISTTVFKPGDETQNQRSWGFGIGNEAGFLVHDRHLGRDRNPPAHFGGTSRWVPILFFGENLAKVFSLSGGAGTTGCQ